MTTRVRVPALAAVCGVALLAAVVACGDGGTAPRDGDRDGRLRYVLASVDGAALPAVYFRRGDTTARVYADTLVFTAQDANEGIFSQVWHAGRTIADGTEERARAAADIRGRYEVVGGRLSFYGYGGPLEGGSLGADPLVLEQPVRGQRWTYRRAP